MSWVVYRALYDCNECSGERTRNETVKGAARRGVERRRQRQGRHHIPPNFMMIEYPQRLNI